MKRLQKLTALFLTVVFVFALFPATSFATAKAAGSAAAEVILGSGTAVGVTGGSDPLPSRYDGRDHGYVPPIRVQNWNHGTCWVFAAIACVECNLIKNGVINPETGNPATTSDVDLSETALAYFHFSNAHDKLGMLEGDQSIPLGLDFLKNCDLGSAVALTLMRWTGPVSETYPAVNNDRVTTSGISAEYGCNYDFAHVESVEWIPISDRDAVKRAIMEYGAATIGMHVDPNYVNTQTDGYYLPPKAALSHQIDHFLAIVGWDDNFPTTSFSRYGTPSQNGAWICKNSQGRFSPTNDDYLYVSYEDYFMQTDTCYFYKVGNLDNYQYNYQYDGTCNDRAYLSADSGTQIANVFTANGHETLKAVAVNVRDQGVSYTLDVYRNPTGRDPSSGVKVSTQTGSFAYPGYFTVPLNTAVELNANDTFAVVFTLTSSASNGSSLRLPYDCSAAVDHVQWVHVDHGDTSFYRPAGGAWTDCPNHGDFRIKAYTDDYVYTVTYDVSAESNNDAYGTVSVTGSTITASPAEGYYVSGCEVISGTATYAIDGNTILVYPSSDCTVRVIFAATPTYCVNFLSCGVSVGSQNVAVNGQITLPSVVPETPDDWSFCGWVTQSVEETADEPIYYAPGARYTVQSDSVLYALFTRTQGNSEVGFQLLTAAPDTWEGNYVITYTASAGSMRVLKGKASVTGADGMSTAECAPALSGTGIQLNQNLLTNVAEAYQFHIFPNGSNYYIQNVGFGSYIGGTTTLFALTSSNGSFLPWTLTMSNGAAQMKNVYKGNYLNYNTSGFFNLTSSAGGSIFLWKEAPLGTTYYSTEFAPAHVHTVQHVDAVAATCTSAGQAAYYSCNSTSCPLYGQVFADEALTEALTDLTVPALGHTENAAVEENRVEPTETAEGGYDTVVYCARCGAELSRTHTTLPALPVVHTHVLTFFPAAAPTCVEAGHSAYYFCEGCGRYFSDAAGANEISPEDTVIPATGNHSYGAWSSNRNGTHSRVCTVCSTVDTVNCTYTNVVTPPTATERGYTTHTCGVCGYSFVDTFVDVVGETFTISFSVPEGVNPVASMQCSSKKAINLPTPGAPDGCTFVGWTLAPVSTTTELPSIVQSKNYKPTASRTLYALYSARVGDDTPYYAPLTAKPGFWSGNYVITCGDTPNGLYLIKGLAGTKNYESSSSGGAIPLASSGMTYADGKLIGQAAPYVFKISLIAPDYVNYSISSKATGSYLGNCSTFLYSHNSYIPTYCKWTFAFNANNGTVTATNTATLSYIYLSFSSNRYFMVGPEDPGTLRFWKETIPEGITYYASVPDLSQMPAAPAEPLPDTVHTISFSVPNGVSPIPDVIADRDSVITLPTAEVPEGCVFLGWIKDALPAASSMPRNVLTGSYTVTENAQLHALYSYYDGGTPSFRRLSSAPSDWNGNYVITCNAANGSVYVLNALSGNTRYESVSCDGTKLLSDVGITVDGDCLTNVPRTTVFKIAKISGSYHTIQNTSSNTYVSVISSYLSCQTTYSAAYCRWSFSMSNGAVVARTAATTRYPYLALANRNFFALSTTAPTNIYFWKECDGAVLRYSTFPA